MEAEIPMELSIQMGRQVGIILVLRFLIENLHVQAREPGLRRSTRDTRARLVLARNGPICAGRCGST